MNASENYEFLFWIRLTASSGGDFVTLTSSSSAALQIGTDGSLHVYARLPGSSVLLTSTNTLSLNTWTQISVKLSSSELIIDFNGTVTRQTITRAALPSTSAQIGIGHGQMDEFMFSSRILDTPPSTPMQGTINLSDIGGFGSGSLGNVVITSDCVMNTTADVRSIEGSDRLGFTRIRAGKFGSFTAGQEVMIINDSGQYCFGTITYVSAAGVITLNKNTSITVNRYSQLIIVPNFNTLTINKGVTVSPNAWTNYSGGIVAFRVKGNCTINGSIITSGKGRTRTDSQQLTHSRIVDNFITNTGGGIFITCGGTLTAPSSARLGASWSGTSGAGTATAKNPGSGGGAGYGGGGGSDPESMSLGGKGGVGGAGGGGDGNNLGDPVIYGGDAGSSGTGGFGYYSSSGRKLDGGTQGKTTGGNAENSGIDSDSTGGGGAGGNGGTQTHRKVACGVSGANVIIIANTLKLDAAALSTGGGGGQSGAGIATGGGGTGFAYIAAKEVK